MHDPGSHPERDKAWSMPLEQIDVSKGYLFEQDIVGWYFERLRQQDPVHHVVSKRFGPYWSVTRYQDILAVDTDHASYSSDAYLGGISLAERPADEVFPSFIAMDPPRHDEQRKTVSPIVAPANLALLEATIRERAARILDGLPIGEEFDWVQRVSIELTTQMLATLFDFPFEDRHLLTWWSDMATGDPDGNGPVTLLGDAPRRARQVPGLLHPAVESARQRRAAQRPDLDAGARPGHAPHEPAGVSRQRHPADRRRQRHHAQLDQRRAAGAEPLPGRIRQAARQPGPGRQPGAGDHPLADAAGAHAPHRHARHAARAARPSARATRW